ncbi:MAG: GNAT family N-acetyltransferase [Oscillospiraceae bacterium]|nr:GNAT family N-acetyltransferase [Oscillospiraceae bacterium]
MDLKTTRMLLRDFIPEDADDLQEILGDAEVMEFSEAPYDLEKTKAFLASFCIEKHGAVAAVHKESGKVIGYILFNEIEPDVYEMGWFFNRRFWRQGYAYESCKAVIDYAFGELKAHKVFAEAIDAVKSVSLMKKLGMQLEGIQRSQTKDNHGNWADLYFYGLLEDDWRKQ